MATSFTFINGVLVSVDCTSGVLYVPVDFGDSSAAAISCITVHDGGSMVVHSGGTVNLTSVYSQGSMFVDYGGMADNTAVNPWGTLHISRGGTANSTTVYRGSMYVSSGGTANFTTVNSYGSMYVLSDGMANNTTVDSWGTLYISRGGTAAGTTLNSSGGMYVSSGGTADSVTVNSNGFMYVYSGGTANGIAASRGARLNIVVAPNTYIQGTYAGSAFEMKNAGISGYTVDSGGLWVRSGGLADSIIVNSNGSMMVSSGGTANDITVAGSMYVYSFGAVNSTTVNPGGYLKVFSSGTATAVMENGGEVVVADGADVTFIPNVFSGIVLSRRATVHSGTTAVGILISSGVNLMVSSGGTAKEITVNPGAVLTVGSDAAASVKFNPWSGGSVISAAGAAITYLERDACIYFGNSSCGLVSKYNSVSGLTAGRGESALVYSGGTAVSTTINSGGRCGSAAAGKLPEACESPMVRSLTRKPVRRSILT